MLGLKPCLSADARACQRVLPHSQNRSIRWRGKRMLGFIIFALLEKYRKKMVAISYFFLALLTPLMAWSSPVAIEERDAGSVVAALIGKLVTGVTVHISSATLAEDPSTIGAPVGVDFSVKNPFRTSFPLLWCCGYYLTLISTSSISAFDVQITKIINKSQVKGVTYASFTHTFTNFVVKVSLPAMFLHCYFKSNILWVTLDRCYRQQWLNQRCPSH